MMPDNSSLAGDHFQRYYVADWAGDKCGTVVVDKSWEEQGGILLHILYVMAITKDKKRGVWERIGLGKVYQLAFQKGGCKWDEIVLG